MAALWIKAQLRRTDPLVLFGKPSGDDGPLRSGGRGRRGAAAAAAQLVPIRLPLMRAKASEIEAAVARWRARLAALPRPLIAILVGGPTVPFAFDARVAERLLPARDRDRGRGGHAVRHHQPAHAARRSSTRCGQGCRAGGAAVRVDAGHRRQPVSRPARPRRRLHRHRRQRLDDGRGRARAKAARDPRSAAWPLRRHRPVARTPVRAGCSPRMPAAAPARRRRRRAAQLLDATRDFRAFHRMLLDQGLAVRAGEPLAPPRGAVPDDLPMVVARINALMGAGVERGSGPGRGDLLRVPRGRSYVMDDRGL